VQVCFLSHPSSSPSRRRRPPSLPIRLRPSPEVDRDQLELFVQLYSRRQARETPLERGGFDHGRGSRALPNTRRRRAASRRRHSSRQASGTKV